jgi:hypothetical protein
VISGDDERDDGSAVLGDAKKVDGVKEEEVNNFDILSDFQERMVQS